jgi:integrase
MIGLGFIAALGVRRSGRSRHEVRLFRVSVHAAVGLSWVNFQVMRRTHSSLMNALGIDGKVVADQLGHTLDVNRNVYTQASVERRKEAQDRLEGMLQSDVNGVQRSTALNGGL